MNDRGYLVVSGTVFGLVALGHLLRVVIGWAVVVGPWPVATSVSVFGTIFAAVLSVWAFRLAARIEV